jgi:hypothetical protein
MRAQSDTHAEVNVVGGCAAAGVPTAGACIYITMPPCKYAPPRLHACAAHAGPRALVIGDVFWAALISCGPFRDYSLLLESTEPLVASYA